MAVITIYDEHGIPHQYVVPDDGGGPIVPAMGATQETCEQEKKITVYDCLQEFVYERHVLLKERLALIEALRASTELLRTMHVTGGVTVSGILNQIAANEAVLGEK